MMSQDTQNDAIQLYTKMLELRLFEEAVQQLFKKGEIPGFIHLYIGQEAVAVGVCHHLDKNDWITSTHRGHGHALAKGVSAKELMSELFGRVDGCNGGRGGSMHLYKPDVGLFGTNGFVGGGIPTAVGVGLSSKVRKSKDISVTFFGDGAVNHGTFHESINLAAVLNVPVIFICENNRYATATPFETTTRNINLAAKAESYGIPGYSVDGNDVLAVSKVFKKAKEKVLNGEGPVLIEAHTYRFVGHHEGDQVVGTYRTQEELDEQLEKCPIKQFEDFLINKEGIKKDALDQIRSDIHAEVDEAIEFARASKWPDAKSRKQFVWHKAEDLPYDIPTTKKTTGWLDAVRDGIAEEMRRNENIIYIGEGIGERGGSFAHTKNLWDEFSGERVIDTPICEMGFTGAAIGAAARNCPAVADLMFSDFIFEAASQIIQQAGKLHYMTNGASSVPLIVRAGYGLIKNAGPHHSGCYYPVWAHCPGLWVAVPSTPEDAKGLMKTALRSKNPVIFLEHKKLFASKGDVPEEEYYIPFGQAKVVRGGDDITIVTCGELVRQTTKVAQVMQKKGISCEVIDLRTIVPLDINTIVTSVKKTGYVLVIDEAFAMCGIGAEIAAQIMEQAFDYLDAPVGRLHPESVTHPFSPPLEDAVVIDEDKIANAIETVIKGLTPHVDLAVPYHSINESQEPLQFDDVSTTENDDNGSVNDDDSDDLPAGAIIINTPNQDLTVEESSVLTWLVDLGDAISKDQDICEMESDKATFTVQAPEDGVLIKIFAEAGDLVSTGGKIAAMIGKQ
ncbi:MAG: thiamine pyrophosphate-dependent enzyme [Lentisphaeria bacterium]|nr:thiamine pyrophosphate-dependent enzyme [Lentisphaeria bacterium]